MIVAQKKTTLRGNDNIFHKIFCAHFVKSTFVSSVGRAWDCSEKVCFDIPRSPAQSALFSLPTYFVALAK